MKAAYIHKFGGPEVLQVGRSARSDRRGRVRSWSTSPPPASTAPTGRCAPANTGRRSFPLILGRDFSGAVSALGAGVTDLQGRRRGVRRARGRARGRLCREDRDRRGDRRARSRRRCRHVDAAALALTGLTALVRGRGRAEAEVRRDHPDPGRRGRRGELRHPACQAYRRPRHHHRERGERCLPARARRRRGDRLQRDRLHQGGEELSTRCSTPWAATSRRGRSPC